jgi:hypothetical protein
MTLKPQFHFLEVAYPYVARCVCIWGEGVRLYATR